MLLPRCSLPLTSKTQLISERDGGAKGPMPDEPAGDLPGKTDQGSHSLNRGTR